MTTLSEEMDEYAAFLLRIGGEREIRPMLLLVDTPKEGRVVAGLEVGDGAAQARMVRILVAQHAPRLALFGTEAWMLKRTVPTTDPDYKRLLQRKIAPSQLPRAKRGEVLIVMGESADGETQTRMWEIETVGGGGRALEPLEEMHTTTNRFSPMFVVEDSLRRNPPPADLPHDLVEGACRALALKHLLSSDTAGMTTSAFEGDTKTMLRDSLRRLKEEGR